MSTYYDSKLNIQRSVIMHNVANKIIKPKLSLLELAKQLGNVSKSVFLKSNIYFKVNIKNITYRIVLRFRFHQCYI